MIRTWNVVAVALTAFAAIACTSVPPGATAVPAADIRQSLSDRTWEWERGGPGAGVYFAPDGVATMLWEGRYWDTTWSTRDGAFCYQHSSGDRCWALYEKDGVLYSRSLWEPENDEYRWDPATQTRSGRHI